MVAPGGRGCVWLLGGMCVVARGACVVARGGMHGCYGEVCGCSRGACMVAPGGMRGCSGGGGGACVVFPGGACMVSPGGHAWFFLGGCIGYDEIRSMSGRYASYWNAFLLYLVFTVTCYMSHFKLNSKMTTDYSRPYNLVFPKLKLSQI